MVKGARAPAVELQVEGNNGGSYVWIRSEPHEDFVTLDVGHECVTRVFSKNVKVTDLAKAIARAYDRGELG